MTELREFVASRIEFELTKRAKSGVPMTELTGAIWVPQTAYGSSEAGRDQQLALGGTYFEYQIIGSSANGGLEVALTISDHYFWSPSDLERATQCLHEAGAQLVAEKRAAEFHQIGHGTIVVNDPSRGRPMMPLDVSNQEND